MRYGSAPVDMGKFEVSGDEMMMYVYLPVYMPGHGFAIPDRLLHCQPLLMACFKDFSKSGDMLDDPFYIYLTFKRMWVEAGAPGNRPGWHADGYGSNGDLNYIWADMNPTQFAIQEFRDIPDDDIASMEVMEAQVDPKKIVTYPDKHLLRLDESVVHRVNPEAKSGVRTFLKISVSRHRYNLKGNSHNYMFDYNWPMFDRFERRNVDNKDFALEVAT